MAPQSSKFSSFITQQQPLKVRVHPLVELAILDAYTRRPKKETRAIGTLLGYVSEGSVLEVTECFQVVHSDSQDRGVLLDQGYHGRCVELKKVVNPKEVVVGWFSVSGETKSTLNDSTVSVHQFYSKKESGFKVGGMSAPIYLQMDCGNGIHMKCFSSGFIAGSEQNLLQFFEMPMLRASNSPEEKILQVLASATQQNFVANGYQVEIETTPIEIEKLDGLKSNLMELRSLFVQAKQYADDVVSNKQVPKASIGRGLLKELKSTERALNQGAGVIQDQTLSDTIMVKYLATLCKTQISLSEKINHQLTQVTE